MKEERRDAIQNAIEKLFDPDERGEVKARLSLVPEHLWPIILAVSYGDRQCLDDLVDDALRDTRDVVVISECPGNSVPGPDPHKELLDRFNELRLPAPPMIALIYFNRGRFKTPRLHQRTRLRYHIPEIRLPGRVDEEKTGNTKLGGDPVWVRHDATPLCCGGYMTLVGQFDLSYVSDARLQVGTNIYSFLCDRCGTAVSILQHL